MSQRLLANPQSVGKQMLASGFNDKRHIAARKALLSGNIAEAMAAAERVASSNAPWAMYVLAAAEWFRGHRMRTAGYSTRGLRLPPNGPIETRYQHLLRQIEAEFTAGVPEMLAASPRPLLSVCMITRDEERGLARCLKSVASVADEIVVVDTGSKDHTIEIAKAAGARVKEIEWPNDFAAARNAALDAATGDWVLSIDGDEWLDEIAYRPLRACLADPSCSFIPLVKSHSGGQSFVNTRLFPRKGARWKGSIHEDIEPNPDVMSVQISAILLHHDGYAPEVVEAQGKGERNKALIEAMKQHGPKERQTAEIFEALHDSAHAKTNEEAIAALQSAVALNTTNSGLMRQVFNALAIKLTRDARFEEALQLVELAEKRDLQGLWSYYILARMAYENGDKGVAKKWARTGLAMRDYEGPTEQYRKDLEAIRDGTF